MNAINPYLKFIVALIGALVTGLSVYYSGAHWFPVVTSVATALTVLVTPNVASETVTKKPFTGE